MPHGMCLQLSMKSWNIYDDQFFFIYFERELPLQGPASNLKYWEYLSEVVHMDAECCDEYAVYLPRYPQQIT